MHDKIAVILVALALGACATTPSSESESASGIRSGRADDCMFAVALRDWRPLDNSNLILFGSGRRNGYHVELFRPALALRSNVMIGVYDRDGRICPYGGDAIIVDGPMPERIPIRAMRRLDEQQLEELYVQFGIRPPAIVHTESAEIESEDSTGEPQE